MNAIGTPLGDPKYWSFAIGASLATVRKESHNVFEVIIDDQLWHGQLWETPEQARDAAIKAVSERQMANHINWKVECVRGHLIWSYSVARPARRGDQIWCGPCNADSRVDSVEPFGRFSS